MASIPSQINAKKLAVSCVQFMSHLNEESHSKVLCRAGFVNKLCAEHRSPPSPATTTTNIIALKQHCTNQACVTSSLVQKTMTVKIRCVKTGELQWPPRIDGFLFRVQNAPRRITDREVQSETIDNEGRLTTTVHAEIDLPLNDEGYFDVDSHQPRAHWKILGEFITRPYVYTSRLSPDARLWGDYTEGDEYELKFSCYNVLMFFNGRAIFQYSA